MQEEGRQVEIARMGHPVLMAPAARVADIDSPEVQKVIDDMLLAHEQSGGVGIAAPQVYSSLRIILFEVTMMCALAKSIPERPVTILVNPVVDVLDDAKTTDWEGCLSVPGMYGEVSRFNKIRYSGFDRAGKAIEGVLEGYAARIVQHEVDHIDGVLYPMRITNLKRFGFLEEVREFLLD